MCISALFLACFWVGCHSDSEQFVDKPVFYMNLEAGLSTLDPAFARDQATIWMTSQLFNGLVGLDGDLKVKPAIAKDWSLSEDQLTYTFHLRPEVRYHLHPAFGNEKTRAVTAADFVYSFTRICDPDIASSGKWIFNHKIKGLEAFTNGEAEHVSGFEAVDDTTLKVHLTKPFPPMLSLLAMPYAFVLPKEVVEWKKDEFRARPIGTGPFQFYKWKEGEMLVFHKNPEYFESDEEGSPLPYLDAVAVRFIPSRLSAFIEFVQGNLDFINGVDDAYKDEILALDGNVLPEYQEKYKVIQLPQLNTEYLGFQMDTSLEMMKGHPLQDVRVRKALNYAIDREKLTRYLLNGMGYPGNSGFMPKGMPGHDPEKVPGFSFKPELARELLAEAGYPNGEGFPELTLNSNANYNHISVFVQKAFENIGIRLSIQNMQGGALRKEIYNSRIHFWRASWIADYPDGENYLSLFYSNNHAPNGPNTTHFTNPALDRLYEAALIAPNDSIRVEYYQEMERIMLEQAPVIILFYDRIIRLAQNNIEGLAANPMNHLSLKRVKKK